jgi:integrase
MSKQNVSKRHTRHQTRHRGLFYRLKADGSRTYYGFVSGKGRVALKSGKEREALAEWNELRGKAARGERIPTTKLKLAEVGEEHLREAEKELRRGVEYRRTFERVIVPVLGHRRITEITAHDLIRLDRSLRASGLSEATVANYLKPLRGTFEYAALEYAVPNPFLQVPRGRLSSCNRTREHREWTTADVLNLIARGYELDERPDARAQYGLAIETKLRTGARLGELLGMRYGDIDRDQGVWSITAQWTREGELTEPKTKKSLRRVPLAPELLRKLAARKLRTGSGDEDFVFASRKGGRPISHTNFRRRAWKPAVEAAGLTDGPKVTPHDARHAFASEMADRSLSSADVAEVMGHTTAGITERIYTHTFNRDAREERVRQAMAAAMSERQRLPSG